jgi:hypothetical protein
MRAVPPMDAQLTRSWERMALWGVLEQRKTGRHPARTGPGGESDPRFSYVIIALAAPRRFGYSAAAFRPACKPSRTSSMILATSGRDQRASGS